MNRTIAPSSPAAGYLYALITVILWSVNFIIARDLNGLISPVSLAFFRWSTAAVLVLPFSCRSIIRNRRTIFRHFPYLALTSFLGVALFNTLVYLAGRTTTAINLSIIAITFPIHIVILSRILFNERISPARAAGMIMVIAGALLLITEGDLSELRSIGKSAGDLWMVLAAFIFAVFTILLKFRPPELELFTFQSTTFIIGTLFLLPLFIYDRITGTAILWDAQMVGSILYVGIGASLIAYLLWNRAISIIGPAKTGFVYYTLPLFSALNASLLLGEHIEGIHLVSMVCIIAGVLLAGRSGSAPGRREPM
ncbi:MAG: DMT family transporter [Spirochaetia bacterium]|nr:DMT family transporter [Spirochaetia bacterium]